MAPRKRAPRKAATKKAAPKKVAKKVVEEQENPWYKIWPKSVVDKHIKRQADNVELRKQKVAHKKQRLSNNGVPPEKHAT